MRIIDDIKEFQTTRERPVLTDVPLLVKDSIEETCSFKNQYLYKIQVLLGRRVWCEKGEIENIKRNVRRELQDYIYGEVKRELLALERNIYEGEFQTAKERITKILHQLCD